MATVLPPPPPPPKLPIKKDLWFEIPSKIILEKSEAQRIEEEKDDAGLVDEDSNEFGLTKRDYNFIQEDIAYQIAKFDEEHGFDGTGYHEKDGSYIYPLDKVKTLNQKHKNKISSQEVAIARGIIKVHRPSFLLSNTDNADNSKKEGD